MREKEKGEKRGGGGGGGKKKKKKKKKKRGKNKEIKKENEMRINTFECMLILNYFAIFLIL